MNSAATLYVSGVVPSIKDGIDKANHLIDSGRAMKKLEGLISSSKGL